MNVCRQKSAADEAGEDPEAVRAAEGDAQDKGQSMNRGSLAEDPRSDYASSSRYSRNHTEKNHLLYASDLEWEESARREQKASSKKNHQSDSRITEPDHRFLPESAFEKKAERDEAVSPDRSAGAAASSSLSRLEVGRHGRLLGVVGKREETASSAAERAAERAGESTQETDRIQKQDRPYLMQNNPLLARDAAQRSRRSAAAQERSAGKKLPDRRKTEGMPVRSLRRERDGYNPLLAAAAGGTVRAHAPAASRHSAFRPEDGRAQEKETRRPFSVRKALIAAGCGIAAAAYISGAIYYSDRFYPGTKAFGISAGGMTVDELKEQVKDRVAGYSLTILERGGESETVTAKQISLSYSDDGYIDRKMKRQYSALWPVMIAVRSRESGKEKIGTGYDAGEAKEVIESLQGFDDTLQIAPEDAQLKFTSTNAYVSKEVMGTTLKESEAEKAILDALDEGLTTVDLDALSLYEDPSVYSDDDTLCGKADALNEVLGADLTLEMGDRSREISAQVIAEEFLSLDRDGRYYLDSDKVTAYVAKLAEETDTLGGSRTFQTSLGTTVELSGGDYGWQMDAETTASDLAQMIRDKKTGSYTPSYFSEGMCRDEDDIGDSYVEIDITNQHMWCYSKGTLVVDTPVVTGNPLKNNATPSGGVWRVDGKYRNAVLKGQGYASPVDYWIPFNGGVGIHDLKSRWYFGGTVYIGAGSHGCVNTPLAAVKLIYQAVQTGTPVVVYEDDSQEAVSQNTGMQDIGTITAQIEAQYGTVDDTSPSDDTITVY